MRCAPSPLIRVILSLLAASLLCANTVAQIPVALINPITPQHKFSRGDSFIVQDLRVTRAIKICENIKPSLIGDVFNAFNVANLSGYSNVLNQLNYGQATARAGQVLEVVILARFSLPRNLEF
jgi:hypothetical protein